MKKKILIIIAVTVVLLVGYAIYSFQKVNPRVSLSTSEASGEPLLHQADLTYEGFFNIPTSCGNIQTCAANFGGLAMAYDPAGNGGQGSLFVSGIPLPTGLVAEISIPTTGLSPNHTSFSQAPTATLIKGFSDITAGHLPEVQPGDGSIYVSGLLPFQNNKILLAATDYFGAPIKNQGFALFNKDLSNASMLTSWQGITTDGSTNLTGCNDLFAGICGVNVMNGGFAPIPSAWQGVLDGDTLAGNCCVTVNPIPGDGPSYTSFWSTDIGVKNPAPGHLLLWYTEGQHPTIGSNDGMTVGNPNLYTSNGADFSVVWPIGSRSILSFEPFGTAANSCYGPPVGQQDSSGYPYYPIATGGGIAGTGASTSADGKTVYIPNVSGLANHWGQYGNPQHGIWLKSQTSPISHPYWKALKGYRGVSELTGYGNEGTPSAYVTVKDAFPPNLTNQDFLIGEWTCYDPTNRGALLPDTVSIHGPTAYPYEYRVLAYDANDLLAVKNGSKKVWEPVPYDFWTFNLPVKNATPPFDKKTLGAAAYDPTHHKIYLAQTNADSQAAVIITVWNVNVSGGSATPTPNVSISANPSTINSGSSSTISWSSTNSTSCTASGGWSGSKATSGSQSVSPTSNTTYTITCTGAGGSANQSATVTVSTANVTPTVTISASPSSISTGASSTITWSSNNTTSCTASGAWSGSKTTSGTQSVSPTATSTYTITCAGSSGGSANQSATVTVSGTTTGGGGQPSPDCTKASAITDPNGNVWTFGTNQYAYRNGVLTYAAGFEFLLASGKVYIHDLQNPPQWWEWVGGAPGSGNVQPRGTTQPACTSTQTLVGDLNNDGIVNSLDWSIMNSKWFTSDTTADLNHDGIVNSIDFSILNNNWLKTSS